jgi:hypothetical protein
MRKEFGAEDIKRISSEKFKREVRMTREEENEEGETEEVVEKFRGVNLKKELAGIPKEKRRRASRSEMNKELKRRGVRGSQESIRKKTIETIEDQVSK